VCAAIIAGQTPSEAPVTITAAPNGSTAECAPFKKGLSSGAAAGVGIGSALGGMILAAALAMLFFSRRKKGQAALDNNVAAQQPNVQMEPHGTYIGSAPVFVSDKDNYPVYLGSPTSRGTPEVPRSFQHYSQELEG
jgi:hypothetical protein